MFLLWVSFVFASSFKDELFEKRAEFYRKKTELEKLLVPPYPNLDVYIGIFEDALREAAERGENCARIPRVSDLGWEMKYGGTELAEKRRREGLSELRGNWAGKHPEIPLEFLKSEENVFICYDFNVTITRKCCPEDCENCFA